MQAFKQKSIWYLLVFWGYIFLPFPLLYWFSDKVGVLCQESHFPDDLAQSVHQPTTLVSTFLPLTLGWCKILKKFVKYQNKTFNVPDNFIFINRPSMSPPIDINGAANSKKFSKYQYLLNFLLTESSDISSDVAFINHPKLSPPLQTSDTDVLNFFNILKLTEKQQGWAILRHEIWHFGSFGNSLSMID